MSAATLKRFAVIAVVLGLSVWSIVANEVVLGLDLRGGVTMRYELEPPDTLPEGVDVGEMIESTVETLRQRIDAYGIKEHSLVRQGEREIVIELPGKGKDESQTIKSVISRVGRLEWRIVATDDLRNGLTVAEERERMAALLEEHRGELPQDIDVTVLDRRFPDVIYRWVPYSDRVLAEKRRVANLEDLPRPDPDGKPLAAAPLAVDPQPGAGDFELLRIESAADRHFTGADIDAAYATMDSRGGRAVGVSIRPDRAGAFADFSEEHKGQHLSIVLDGRLAQTPAVIHDRLDREFVIQAGSAAGFPEQDIKDYLTIIRSGSLKMKPRLLFENTIGPTLGESSIKAGTNAALAGLIVTVLFMLAYYRWHGLHATTTLLLNVIVLTGLLMLLGATVTLPGIAGLVLTFGMAIDANILIYERMREEVDRAKSPAQVVKLGFERALSTIVDSNVTTFITALILYKLGSGPVRGFAVVLMLGLVTSVWGALYVGRALYDWAIESGRMKTVGGMARLVRPGLHLNFMRYGTTTLRVSAIAAAASLVLFVTMDPDKFGLDFVGGYKAQVRLVRPATQGEVKGLVGGVFAGAQVVTVGVEPGDPGSSREFLVKVKGTAGAQRPADGGDVSLEQLYEQPIKQALGGLLRPDFVSDLTLVADDATATTVVSGRLSFEGPVEPDRLASQLGFISRLEVEPTEDGSVAIRGVVAGTGLDEDVLAQRIKSAVEDSASLPPLSTPLLESTLIGGRVGSELRDSAIRALLFSFIAIVLYIRLRFRDYHYGFAAVLCLLHDVLVTAGIVTLAHQLGIVDAEIDLTMIAAFLTIIGYSLNDTIVLFDRVRENLPRLDKPLSEVIDVSMNQVLARSLLTSITVLMSLIIIFAMNVGRQNLLEGFAFAMIVGIVVGTYSSVYVASPLLLLFARRKERAAA